MQRTTEAAERLVGIANELMQIAKSLGNEAAREPEFPLDSVHKIAAGICLGCGRAKKVGESFRRGNCPTCSNRINRELDRALVRLDAEHQLISDGLLAPKGYRIEPDPVRDSLAKVAARADVDYADPSIQKPTRKRAKGKK